MTDNCKNNFVFVIIWTIIIIILLGCYDNRKKEKELKYIQEYLEQSEYSGCLYYGAKMKEKQND